MSPIGLVILILCAICLIIRSPWISSLYAALTVGLSAVVLVEWHQDMFGMVAVAVREGCQASPLLLVTLLILSAAAGVAATVWERRR